MKDQQRREQIEKNRLKKAESQLLEQNESLRLSMKKQEHSWKSANGRLKKLCDQLKKSELTLLKSNDTFREKAERFRRREIESNSECARLRRKLDLLQAENSCLKEKDRTHQ